MHSIGRHVLVKSLSRWFCAIWVDVEMLLLAISTRKRWPRLKRLHVANGSMVIGKSDQA